jgi:hypothetical protein
MQHKMCDWRMQHKLCCLCFPESREPRCDLPCAWLGTAA